MKLIIAIFLYIFSLNSMTGEYGKYEEALKIVKEYEEEIEETRLKNEKALEEKKLKNQKLEEAKKIIAYINLRDALNNKNEKEIKEYWPIRCEIVKAIEKGQKEGFIKFVTELMGEYTDYDESCWVYFRDYIKEDLKNELKNIFSKHNKVNFSDIILFSSLFSGLSYAYTKSSDRLNKSFGYLGLPVSSLYLFYNVWAYVNYDSRLKKFLQNDDISYESVKEIKEKLKNLRD